MILLRVYKDYTQYTQFGGGVTHRAHRVHIYSPSQSQPQSGCERREKLHSHQTAHALAYRYVSYFIHLNLGLCILHILYSSSVCSVVRLLIRSRVLHFIRTIFFPFTHSSCSFQFIVCFLLLLSFSSSSAAFRLYCECMKLYLLSDTQREIQS